jgi:isopropylmalate/homocitrate/citramalate synthase
MSISTTFKQFEIKASYKGDKKWNDDTNNWNNHMIKVTNTETKQSIAFEFWSSIVKPEITEEKEVLFAFECLILDSIAGDKYFEDFCSEFGYDTDSRKAEKIHKKCIKQLEKLKKIYDGDIYELVNELQEVAG